MPFKERALSAVVVVPTAIIVIVLAYLQYSWSNQVSEATSMRLADSLQMSMINWHQNLFRDFSQICFIFNLDRRDYPPTNLQGYARSLSDWRAVTSYPDLISNMYIAGGGATGSNLLRFNASTSQFESDAWPVNLRTVREELMRPPGGPNAESTSNGIPF